MKINSVTLKNFKRNDNVRYNLTGLDLILGRNGRGKSSILQGITYNLLGKIPETNKKNEDIFEHSKNGESIETILNMDNLSVTRIMATNGRTISEDLSISPMSITTKKLAEKEQYLLSETGIESYMLDFTEFLSKSSTEQQNYLYSLVGSGWNKEKVKEYINLRIKDAEPLLESLINSTLAEFKDSFNIEEGVTAMLNYLESKRKILKENSKKQDSGVKQLAELKNSLNTTDRELAQNKTQLTQYEAALIEVEKKLTNNSNMKKNISNIDAKIAEINLNTNKITAEYNIKAAKLKSNDSTNNTNRNYGLELDENNKLIKMLQVNINDIQEEITDIVSSGKALASKIETLQETVREIIKHRGHCAIDSNIKCSQDFSKYITKVNEDIKIISVNKDNLLKDYQLKKKEKEGIEKEIKKLNESNEIISKLLISQNEIFQLTSEINALVARSKSLVTDKEKLLKERQQIVVVDDTVLSNQKSSIQNEINKLKAKIDSQKEAKVSIALMEQTILQRENTLKELECVKQLGEILGVSGLKGLIVTQGIGPIQKRVTDSLKLMGFTQEFCFFKKGKSFKFGLKDGEKFISYSTLSKGEKLMVTLSLLSVMISKRNPKLKILMLDNLENIDYVYREQVLKALVKIKDNFDNIIVAGALDVRQFKNINDYNILNLDLEEKPKDTSLFSITSEAI